MTCSFGFMKAIIIKLGLRIKKRGVVCKSFKKLTIVLKIMV